MDWTAELEKNRIALTRIVAELLAMVGIYSGKAVERLLRPTESALRRLIIIAARGLVVKPLPKRAMQKGLMIKNKGTGKMRFPLFDKRKRFEFIQHEIPLFVTVKTYEANPFNLFGSLYQPRPIRKKTPKGDRLSRRIEALVHALENLSGQAKRMARWIARQKTRDKPKFTSPLRPGPAPGHRKKPIAEIDYILSNCHWLAWESLRIDSS